MPRNKRRAAREKKHNQAKALAGLIVLGFGVAFLMLRLGVNVPRWIFSWKFILIAIGTVTLYKHDFKSFAGYVLIGIGGAFLLNDYQPHLIDTSLILPVVVILFGILMIGKATNLFNSQKKKRKHIIFDDDQEISSDDFIQTTTLFGGTTKNVVSKNFQGGDFSTAFGGTEINLSKADIQHPITINTSTAFGGVTLIVPSNWQINSDVTTVFGSVEDQRGTLTGSQTDPNKTVTLTGSCFFGGVEIQSYS